MPWGRLAYHASRLTSHTLQGRPMKLAENDPNFTLDPAAVSLSTTYSGLVLLVEQAVACQQRVEVNAHFVRCAVFVVLAG